MPNLKNFKIIYAWRTSREGPYQVEVTDQQAARPEDIQHNFETQTKGQRELDIATWTVVTEEEYEALARNNRIPGTVDSEVDFYDQMFPTENKEDDINMV